MIILLGCCEQARSTHLQHTLQMMPTRQFSLPMIFLKEKRKKNANAIWQKEDLLGCGVQYVLLAFVGLLWIGDRAFFPSFLLGSPFESGSYFVITSDG